MRSHFILSTLILLLVSSQGHAHFGMIIPSESMPGDTSRYVSATLSFSHPFERIGMPLETPRITTAIQNGIRIPFKLQPSPFMDHKAYVTDVKLNRPGAMTLIMEPQPYWEPEEDAFIIHYTKTTLAVWGDDTGWDEPAGLPIEIIPLAKPFGLYAGNAFQGQVLLNGKAVPNAEVEVEFYNEQGRYAAPSELMITQTVKADQNGVFTYAAPWSGWWGFAALNPADYTIDHLGEAKDVELGGVIWVEFKEPVRK